MFSLGAWVAPQSTENSTRLDWKMNLLNYYYLYKCVHIIYVYVLCLYFAFANECFSFFNL